AWPRPLSGRLDAPANKPRPHWTWRSALDSRRAHEQARASRRLPITVSTIGLGPTLSTFLFPGDIAPNGRRFRRLYVAPPCIEGTRGHGNHKLPADRSQSAWPRRSRIPWAALAVADAR